MDLFPLDGDMGKGIICRQEMQCSTRYFHEKGDTMNFRWGSVFIVL